jgi:DNA invertase Pin-like site-specific DNA recombinase
MRVALYARVSTTNHDQDTEVQLRELREYCQQKGWEVAGEYADRISGAKARRPKLDALMIAAKNREFDAVLVWKWSRFARSVHHLHNALKTFNDLGIVFMSKSEQTDTSTPMGKLLFTILSAVDEFLLDVMRDNIMLGLRHAQAQGHKAGPKGPRKTIDIESARRRQKRGDSLRRIAGDMGVSHGLLWKRLQAK